MPNTMKSTQLARLKPETIEAIQEYRSAVESDTNETPYINSAINTLIIIGWNCQKNHGKHTNTRQQRRKATTEAKS